MLNATQLANFKEQLLARKLKIIKNLDGTNLELNAMRELV